MAESYTSDMEQFEALDKSAFVMGYSGVAGSALVNELRKEQKVVDYEKLDDHKDAFIGLDIGFCCMGAHSKDVCKEDYIRINKDYAVKTAEIAKDQGCKEFSIITSKGSNKNSILHALQIKAELEEQLEKIRFDRLSIFRPAYVFKHY